MGNTVIPNRPDMESMKSERSDATIWTMLGYQNVNFKDNVDVVGSLPTVGNEVNDFRLVQENGFVYRWDGSAWGQVQVSGGLESIVPGTNISVNSTDPKNPIISYSGVNKSQITVQISPAQLTGYTVPIEMIPAPGAGKILYVGFWFYEIIMDTTPYNSGTYRFNLTNQTGTLDALAVGNLTPITDSRGNSLLAGPALPNAPLLFTLQNVPTLGDSIVKFTFDYQIIDI